MKVITRFYFAWNYFKVEMRFSRFFLSDSHSEILKTRLSVFADGFLSGIKN